MRTLWTILLAAWLMSDALAQNILINEPVRFLALGDSYTIGQSVSMDERWPNQFVTELRKSGTRVDELKIIAQTGWTTGSLKNAINQQMPLEGFNLVALLIGVNNQFTGGSIQNYTTEFRELLQQSILLAGNDPRHVFVLSIPDYAYTPYGNGNPVISAGIDEFNAVNRFITETFNVKYIDITPISRNGLSQPYLVASDGLHPSKWQYKLWVEEILKYIEKEVGVSEGATNDDPIISLNGRQLLIRSILHLTEFRIYNTDGKAVAGGQLQRGSEALINLEGLPGGIYFLRTIREENRIFIAKLIII